MALCRVSCSDTTRNRVRLMKLNKDWSFQEGNKCDKEDEDSAVACGEIVVGEARIDITIVSGETISGTSSAQSNDKCYILCQRSHRGRIQHCEQFWSS
jgi:hypothetical protein